MGVGEREPHDRRHVAAGGEGREFPERAGWSVGAGARCIDSENAAHRREPGEAADAASRASDEAVRPSSARPVLRASASSEAMAALAAPSARTKTGANAASSSVNSAATAASAVAASSAAAMVALSSEALAACGVSTTGQSARMP